MGDDDAADLAHEPPPPSIHELIQRAADAEYAMLALARGEVDAVSVAAATSPVLLQAAQESLRRSEHLLRSIFDGALDAMLIEDDLGNYVDANPAACELMGLSREQLIGRSIAEFLAPNDAAQADYGRFREQGRTRGRIPLHRVDGGRRILDYGAVANVAPGLHLSVLRDITELVRAEEALRHSEARFRVMLDKSADGVLLTDCDGTTIFESGALARILGVRPGELRPRPLVEAVLEADRPIEQGARAHLLSGAGENVVEYRALQRDGSIRWLEASNTNLLADPDVGAIVTNVRDITARKQLEASTRESELRYRRLIEDLPEPIVVHVDGKIAFANAASAAVAGVSSRDALLGRELEELATPATRTCINGRAAALYRGDPVDRIELSFVRPSDSREIHLEVASIRISFDGLPASLAIARDITERIETSRAAAASLEVQQRSQRLQRIAGTVARLGGWVLDLSSNSVIWSDEVCTIHEVDPGYNPTLPVALQFYAPEHQGDVSAAVRACAEHGTPFDLELEIITAKRQRRWVRAIGEAVRGPDGGILQIQGALKDITERRQAQARLEKVEDQLRQAQKMEAISSLAGGVAHDFNNLLSIILSYADLILTDLQASHPLRPDIEEIQKAGMRAMALTAQLLAFSRKQVLQPIVLDINQVVANVQSMLGRLLGEHIELCFQTPPGVGRIHADVSQIEQVIMNLVVNARDAMPRGGVITLETANLTVESGQSDVPGLRLGPYVMLSVSDTGIGMDHDTQSRIFEPFFTTKELGKGTGLGLSTVYGIVQQSGGHISVSSELGRGSTFKVYLPRSDRDISMSALDSKTSASPRGSETVLVVEDEDPVRKVIQMILRRNGYHVLEAQNAGEAFLIAEQFDGPIHLLLSDVVMPRMSGRQLAERISPLRPDMKVLFVSGYTEDTMMHQGIRDAGIQFLSKPIVPEALLRKIRTVLSGAASISTFPRAM